jgi:hypothetical protein
MENFIPINFHQTRDFSRKMNATFEFVRQNFKSLGKAILFIAGPPVLLASLLMSSFFGDFFTASLNAGRGGEDVLNLFGTPTFWLQLVLIMVFALVSTVTSIATINNYLLLYEQKQSNNIEVSEVWEKVRDSFWMYFGTAFQLTILLIVFYVVLIILIALTGGIPVFAVLGVMALFLSMVYIGIGVSMIFVIRAYEKIGFFEAFFRSFKLINGKWWSTFGLVFVLYIIVGTISYIFMIPWYIMTVVTTLHRSGIEGFENPGAGFGILGTVFLTLYYLVQMLLYALPNIGVAFQYFNLVERKEARGLMNQINTLGQAPTTPVNNDETY